MAVITLAEMPTLRQLYKAGIILTPTHTQQLFLPSSTLLDRISLYQGNITKLHVDAIVNSANRTLLGGGGVDGAIHYVAGRGLLEECTTLGGCETGLSKITKGYRLPAEHVIHTVGPTYSASHPDQSARLLASCYNTSLRLAVQNSLRHIAFCSISTGIYGYPIEDATHVALREVRKFLDDGHGKSFRRIIFVVWSDRDKEVYQRLLPLYFPSDSEPKLEIE